MGDKSALCASPEPQGRLVLGLFGDVAPQTVANFASLVSQGVYTGTLFHKVLPGRYLLAGRQGSKRYGYVDSRALGSVPDVNSDLVSAKAFTLRHNRGGMLSLCIGANDDDAVLKTEIGFKNVEFLITTGASGGAEGAEGCACSDRPPCALQAPDRRRR